MTKRVFALSLIAFSLGLSGMAGAFTHQRDNNGAVVRWPMARAANLNYFVNQLGTADIPGAGEFDVIASALRDWSNVGSSYARFNVPPQPPLTPLGFNPGDGVNVISFVPGFTDPDVPFNVLSFTVLVVQQSGQQPVIVEADVIINDAFFWTENTTNPNAVPPQFNLYAAMLHEAGFMLGLDNTFMRSPLVDLNQVFVDPTLSSQVSFAPVMFPFTLTGGLTAFSNVKNIARDDEVGLSELYPTTDYYDQVGTIRGRVFDARSGQPVFPVHVTAYNANTRQPVVSELNNRDGSFRVRGLAPGSYFLFFEPAPALMLFSPYYLAPTVNFIPTFYKGVLRAPREGFIQVPPNNELVIISVAAGQTVSGIEQPLILGFDGTDTLEPNDELALSHEVSPSSDPTKGTFGVIEDVDNQIRDLDVYRFFADQGDLVRVRVLAQELGSPLDARLRLYSAAALEAYLEQNPDLPNPSRVFREVPPLAQQDNNPESETAPLDPDIIYRVTEGGAFVAVVDRSPLQTAPPRTDPRIDYYQLVVEILSGVIPIPPESDPFPVLSLNLSAQEFGLNPSNAQLLEITFSIRDFNNDGDITYDPGNPLAINDFKDPITAAGSLAQSGVMLYRNDGAEVGAFDFYGENAPGNDRPIPLSEIRVVEYSGEEIRVTLVVAGQELISPEADNTIDYWIVLRTSLNLAQGDDFTVSIPAGGIKLQDRVGGVPRILSVYDSVYPDAVRQNIYSGDIVRFTMPLQPSPDGQRINARSVPTAVLGINMKGAAEEEYWLHEVDVTLVGTNALWFLRAFDYFPVVQGWSAPPTPAILRGQDTFRITDLEFLTVNGKGGIALYRDNDSLDAQGNPVGRDGVFEEDVDLPIELESIEIRRLGRSEIPRRTVAALVPPYQDYLHNFGSTLDLVDAEAYQITLTVRREGQQDKLRVPNTDETSSNTAGADFHVVVRTSSKISAMDTFMPIIRVGGVRVASGLGVPSVPGEEIVSVPSLSKLDESSAPQSRALICRPRPEITVSDLTTETSVLVSDGEDTRLPVFGINANDRGQNAFRMFTTGDFITDRYFNQSYVFDAWNVVVTQVLPGQPAREVYPATGVLQEFVEELQFRDNNPTIPAGGLNLYFDDDTPIGDGRDNDGDFLIDEELVNNIDDDMDGLIDEDVGDGDPAGINGVWDPLDDVHPGGRYYQHRRFIDPLVPPDGRAITVTRRHVFSNADYSLADPITIEDINNALNLRVPVRMNITAEGRQFSFAEYWGVINDPLTLDFDNVFIRTDFAPVWTGMTSIADLDWELDYNGPGSIKDANTVPLFESIGYYVDFPDQVNPLTDFPIITSYSAVVEIPDDDIGPTAGPDFFLVASASPTATPETLLRFEFPAGGFEYSVYQSRWAQFNGAFPGRGGNRVKTAPIRVQGEAVMPTLRLLQPGPGANIASQDQTFNITWTASDPDSIAEIRLYLDTDAIAGNPLIPGSTITRIELTANPLREGINPEFFIVNLNQVISDPRYRHLNFSLEDPTLRFYVVAEIYDRVVDGQPDPDRLVRVYSSGYIVPFRRALAGFLADYIKLHRNGTLSSFGEAPIFFNLQQTANLAIDFEVTQSGGGALGLLRDGQVRASGNIEALNGFVFGQGLFDLGRMAGGLRQVADAVDMEVDFGNGGLVILGRNGELAGYGSLHPEAFVEALSAQAQARVADTPGLSAVGVELLPGFTGGYVLLSNGEVLGAGAGATHTRSGQAGGPPAVDLTLLPTGTGHFVLFADGSVVAAGEASAELARAAPILNRPDARDLELTFSSDGPGLLILRGTGQVLPVGSVEVGFDSTLSENPEDFVALEVFGAAGQDKQAVRDLLDLLYSAYTNEDIGSFMAHVAEDYRDNSGNNREQLRQCLSQIFDIYEMRRNLAQRSMITQTTEQENPRIDVIGNIASATVVTSDAYKVPELAFFDLTGEADLTTRNITFRFPPSDSETDRIPFDQKATLLEIGDGRGWFMEIYDIETVGRVDVGQDFGGLDGLATGTDFDFITRNNAIVHRWVFEKKGDEGPRRISLRYDGPRGNNVYMLLFHRYLLDRQGRFAPPELLVRWYTGREVVFRDRPLFWEFRYSGTRWELVRGQMVMVLPLRSDDVDPTASTVVDPVGFSFARRGPAIEFFEGDVDFHYGDDVLETVCIQGGIVNLTEQFAITTIEEAVSRLEELKRIGRGLLQPTAEVLEDNVYMIVTCDGVSFGFIRVLELFDKGDPPEYDDDNELLVDNALIFDWRYEASYRLGGN